MAHLHGADWLCNDGALSCCDVKGDVHASEGGEDVTEQDDAIWLERQPRLQRDLYLQYTMDCARL
jgi:hypothetical protein